MTTLSERINGVMDEVKALEADKKHQQGYGYISADKILARVGEAMVNNGLSIIPACLQHTTNLHTYTDSYGKEKMLWQVDAQMQMTISDAEEHETTVLWTGSGVDYATPDKALYKAMTSGHKYFIMKLFMVGVGNEDSEHEDYTEISNNRVSKSATRPPQLNANGLTPGDEVLVRGDNDEALGTFKGTVPNKKKRGTILYTVTIKGQDFNVSPDKVKPVERDDEPSLFPNGGTVLENAEKLEMEQQ